MAKSINDAQVWVSPSEMGWRVHRPGAQRDILHTETKTEAVQRAESVARNLGFDTKVQRSNGTISPEGNTYPRGRDKFPPRG